MIRENLLSTWAKAVCWLMVDLDYAIIGVETFNVSRCICMNLFNEIKRGEIISHYSKLNNYVCCTILLVLNVWIKSIMFLYVWRSISKFGITISSHVVFFNSKWFYLKKSCFLIVNNHVCLMIYYIFVLGILGGNI